MVLKLFLFSAKSEPRVLIKVFMYKENARSSQWEKVYHPRCRPTRLAGQLCLHDADMQFDWFNQNPSLKQNSSQREKEESETQFITPRVTRLSGQRT